MDYNTIISKHLRNAAKDILSRISQDVNQENLQLFVTFATDHPGVDIPSRLKKEYPDEMTIVLQYEFENMVVGTNYFSVSLVFDSDMENISIPFSALLHLQDPNDDLDLELEPVNVYDLTQENLSPPLSAPIKNKKSQDTPGEVIDLSQFQQD